MCRRRQPVREIEGASHQAEVGDDVYDISEAASERDRDVQLWGSDCHLSDNQIRKYMVEAEKNNMPPEKAHEILAYCKFDTSKALKICQNFVVPDLFSDYEKRVVQCAVRGEKFDMLSVPDPSQRSRLLKDLLPQQSRRAIMDYYYKNKHNNFEFECRMDDLSPTDESDESGKGDAPKKTNRICQSFLNCVGETTPFELQEYPSSPKME
ncbi:unnamed protein product [Cylicocyclus nassatus]|uniref:ELM2 domain-containing protein n=1 Tax=Cylicocyclus nassatus TaxID=53992 RepID=A0AA36HFE4_CYLNA|nr:unnamed protein product [Cylicocyclus nassatus]